MPFGRKTSWKSKQIVRCECKAMKELERQLKDSIQKEREVGGAYTRQFHCDNSW